MKGAFLAIVGALLLLLSLLSAFREDEERVKELKRRDKRD